MSAPVRGTTVTVRFVNEEKRKHKWGVFWNEYTPGVVGKPKHRVRYLPTEADALDAQAIVRAELAQPVSLTTPVRTHRAADALAAFARDVWLPFVKGHKTGATYKSYFNTITNWIAPEAGHKRYPGLGNLLVTNEAFTTLRIHAYLEQLHAEGVSLSMRRRIKGTLSACCGFARTVGQLTVPNPCTDLGRHIKHQEEDDQETEANPFTPAEVTRIFDQLVAAEDLCWQVFFLWQYHVGTRPGEASALKWEKLDLDRKRAQIEWSYSTVEKRDKCPKTYQRRAVDLTAVLVEQLRVWRQRQRAEAFRRGQPVPEYVFTTARSRILPGGTVRAVFERTMTACGITGHTLYDFRHSFATSHLVLGWDRKLGWVSKQLGHSTPTTTQKHYYAYRDTAASQTFADEIGGWK